MTTNPTTNATAALQADGAELVPVLVYERVSTEEQERSGLGLEDQRAQAARYCATHGYRVVETYQDTASGKTLAKRPGLRAAIERLEDTSQNGERPRALVVAKLDRLARSLIDFAIMIERSQRNGWSIVAVDHNLDLSTAAGRAMANVLMTFAQFEREMIGERVKGAHRAKKARGEHTGRRKGTREIPEPVLCRIRRERGDGKSYAAIAAALNADGVPTARSGKWHMQTVRQVFT